jgi:hypothetical protein
MLGRNSCNKYIWHVKFVTRQFTIKKLIYQIYQQFSNRHSKDIYLLELLQKYVCFTRIVTQDLLQQIYVNIE